MLGVNCIARFLPLAEEGQDQAARDDGGDLSGDVDADGVHQQEVLRVFLQAHLVHDAARHREGRDARRADHGVDLLVLGQEDVQELGKQHAARRVEDEGHKAQGQDQQGVRGEELRRLHAHGDGEAQEDRDQVRQNLLRGLGQRVQHAALADQVAEHQEAHQSHGGALRGTWVRIPPTPFFQKGA